MGNFKKKRLFIECFSFSLNIFAQNFEKRVQSYRAKVIEKHVMQNNWGKHEDSLKFLRILECLFKYSY